MRRDRLDFPPLPHERSQFPTVPPLDSGLAELSSFWLEIRCACGASAAYPLRLLAAERGWTTPLSKVLLRLRCRACRSTPRLVELVDDPTGGRQRRPGEKPVRRLTLPLTLASPEDGGEADRPQSPRSD